MTNVTLMTCRVRESYLTKRISENAISVLMQSWRIGTQK